MDTAAPERLPTRFGFLLLNDFTLISMSAAIDPLREANRLSTSNIYSWRLISMAGEAVVASDGVSVNVDLSIEDIGSASGFDAVIVCSGRRVEHQDLDSVLRWLRRLAAGGVMLGSTCTGSYVLARAGLLDGYECSVHWENVASLQDSFPSVSVGQSIYTIDRDRMTSSGGTAPIDMMLRLVWSQCGPEIGAGVAEQFACGRIRSADELQRVPLSHSLARQSKKLVMAVEYMEANIHEPLSQAELAASVCLSRRQLQRLFQKYLDCKPSRYYLRLRLRRARELLAQTSLSLVEIASKTGFVSSSHFSKSYKANFGHAPSTERCTPPRAANDLSARSIEPVRFGE